jgi:hypothetical protein
MNPPDIQASLKQPQYRWLLIAQILLILLNPVTQHVAWFKLVLVLAFFFVVISTAFALQGSRLSKPALIIGFVALMAQVADLLVEADFLTGLSYGAKAIFLFLVSALILRDIVIRSNKVNVNLIAGAINVYLMAGGAFAYTYAFCSYLQPGSIEGLESLMAGDGVTAYIYFSFVTMTTLGYGDLLPVTPVVMTIAYFQAVFGQLFVAVTIARLVSLQIAQSPSSHN